MAEHPIYLEERIRELEEALRHARHVAEAERRRAEAMEEAARRAYRLAAFQGRRITDA